MLRTGKRVARPILKKWEKNDHTPSQKGNDGALDPPKSENPTEDRWNLERTCRGYFLGMPSTRIDSDPCWGGAQLQHEAWRKGRIGAGFCKKGKRSPIRRSKNFRKNNTARECLRGFGVGGDILFDIRCLQEERASRKPSAIRGSQLEKGGPLRPKETKRGEKKKDSGGWWSLTSKRIAGGVGST